MSPELTHKEHRSHFPKITNLWVEVLPNHKHKKSLELKFGKEKRCKSNLFLAVVVFGLSQRSAKKTRWCRKLETWSVIVRALVLPSIKSRRVSVFR